MSKAEIKICGKIISGMALLVLAAGAATAYAAGGSCQTIFDATDKVIVTPAHIYTTKTAASGNTKTNASELIYSGGANGAIYVMVDGKWTHSRLTPADMLKQAAENRSDVKASCQYVRDEAVDGQTAQVFSAQSVTENEKTSVTIWISRSKGLPLKEDVDIDLGGSIPKDHRSIRYEYTNVGPPAGVQ